MLQMFRFWFQDIFALNQTRLSDPNLFSFFPPLNTTSVNSPERVASPNLTLFFCMISSSPGNVTALAASLLLRAAKLPGLPVSFADCERL